MGDCVFTFTQQRRTKIYLLTWKQQSLNANKGTAIQVPVGSIVSDRASLRFTGKGAANYGTIQQENLMRLLEHFADNVPPAYPTVGQMWYDTANSILQLCVSTSPLIWRSIAGIQIATLAPNPAAVGDLWFYRSGTASGILYIYTGLGRHPSNPATIGGWEQVWPQIEAVAGREEFDSMMQMLKALIGPVADGGNGALGKLITNLPDFTLLDADKVRRYNALAVKDPNVLVPTTSPTTDLVIDPTSQDWDMLLAAFRYAISRLELPPDILDSISTVPFINDGRPVAPDLLGYDTSDPRYPTLERRSNRRFGIATLARAYQETINVVVMATNNRYTLKGINGTSSQNTTFSPAVQTFEHAMFNGYVGNLSTISTTVRFNFASKQAREEFINAGSIIQIAATVIGAQNVAGRDFKTMADQRGVVRINADKTRVYPNAQPYSLSEQTTTGLKAASEGGTLVGTFGPNQTRAAYQVYVGIPTPTQLHVTWVSTVSSAVAAHLTLTYSIIRDTTTYMAPALTAVYPFPAAFQNSDWVGSTFLDPTAVDPTQPPAPPPPPVGEQIFLPRRDVGATDPKLVTWNPTPNMTGLGGGNLANSGSPNGGVLLSNGNLTAGTYANYSGVGLAITATKLVNTGKWYYELRWLGNTGGVRQQLCFGIAFNVDQSTNAFNLTSASQNWPNAITYNFNTTAVLINGATGVSNQQGNGSGGGSSIPGPVVSPTPTQAGDVFAMSWDMGTKTFSFWKNGSEIFASTWTPNYSSATPFLGSQQSNYTTQENVQANFGRQAFSYTKPTGYSPLDLGETLTPPLQPTYTYTFQVPLDVEYLQAVVVGLNRTTEAFIARGSDKLVSTIVPTTSWGSDGGGGDGGTFGAHAMYLTSPTPGMYDDSRAGGGAGGYNGNGGNGGNANYVNRSRVAGGRPATGSGAAAGGEAYVVQQGGQFSNEFTPLYPGGAGGGVGLFGAFADGVPVVTNPSDTDYLPKQGGFGSLLRGPYAGAGSRNTTGGNLRWRNNIPVTPGETLTVNLGAYGSAAVSGNQPAVRIIWGAGRTFPFNALELNPSGQILLSGVTSWTVPPNVTNISVVCQETPPAMYSVTEPVSVTVRGAVVCRASNLIATRIGDGGGSGGLKGTEGYIGGGGAANFGNGGWSGSGGKGGGSTYSTVTYTLNGEQQEYGTYSGFAGEAGTGAPYAGGTGATGGTTVLRLYRDAWSGNLFYQQEGGETLPGGSVTLGGATPPAGGGYQKDGGSLAYKNSITVTPGEIITINAAKGRVRIIFGAGRIFPTNMGEIG